MRLSPSASRRMRRVGVAAIVALLAFTAAACGGGGKGDASGQKLTVLAAASLKTPFDRIGDDFAAANGIAKVNFSYAGSSDLVSQIQQGSPADVFASADTINMDKLTKDKLNADAPVNFATNVLRIVTAPGNPLKIKDLSDLANARVKTVLCAPQVPCGNAAKRVEKRAGVKIRPVSEEQSVTDVLNKVVNGEADAGLVYVTDAKEAGKKVTGVDFPESSGVVNTYPIVPLKDAPHSKLAAKFIDYVTGPKGRKALADAGFGKP